MTDYYPDKIRITLHGMPHRQRLVALPRLLVSILEHGRVRKGLATLGTREIGPPLLLEVLPDGRRDAVQAGAGEVVAGVGDGRVGELGHLLGLDADAALLQQVLVAAVVCVVQVVVRGGGGPIDRVVVAVVVHLEPGFGCRSDLGGFFLDCHYRLIVVMCDWGWVEEGKGLN